jgi:hypothetical protein
MSRCQMSARWSRDGKRLGALPRVSNGVSNRLSVRRSGVLRCEVATFVAVMLWGGQRTRVTTARRSKRQGSLSLKTGLEALFALGGRSGYKSARGSGKRRRTPGISQLGNEAIPIKSTSVPDPTGRHPFSSYVKQAQASGFDVVYTAQWSHPDGLGFISASDDAEEAN